MERRAATALHLALIVLGTALYIAFVLPRWWVLTGSIPATVATVGRIAAGIPIAAAAVPVWQYLQRSMRPSAGTPELALRLRAWSAVLHVIAGALILLAALTEFLVSLDAGGPYLFGVYGAAGAITVLAVAAFYLSFVAEKPPAEAKPAKEPKAKKPRRFRRTKTDKPADVAVDDASAESIDESGESAEPDHSAADTEASDEAMAGSDDVNAEKEPATGGLRNRRLGRKAR